jgi:hypothetical protein
MATETTTFYCSNCLASIPCACPTQDRRDANPDLPASCKRRPIVLDLDAYRRAIRAICRQKGLSNVDLYDIVRERHGCAPEALTVDEARALVADLQRL